MSPPAQTALAQDQPLCHDNTCTIPIKIMRSATSGAIRQFDVNDDIVSILHVSNSLFDAFLTRCRKTAHHCSKRAVCFSTWSSRIWINMRINPFASNFFHSCVSGKSRIWKPQVHTGIPSSMMACQPRAMAVT